MLRTITWAVIALVAICAASYIAWQFIPRDPGPKELTTGQLFDLKLKCAESAETYLKSEVGSDATTNSSQTNHYDPEKGICYVLVWVSSEETDAAGTTTITTWTINDAVERENYGMLHTLNRPDGRVVLDQCIMSPDGLAQETCSKSGEWHSYARSLMQ